MLNDQVIKGQMTNVERDLSLLTSSIIENGYTFAGDAVIAKSRDCRKRLEINDFKEREKV